MALHPIAPKVSYGTGPTVIQFKLPQMAWTPMDQGIGGASVSGAGVPAAWQQRRDFRVKVTIRFFESEWASVSAWLAYAQAAHSFDWWFNPADSTSKITCYLDKPLMNEEVAPQRDTDFLGVYKLELTLRRTTQTVIDYRITGY